MSMCGVLTQNLHPLERNKRKTPKTRGCVKGKREYRFQRPCIAAHFVEQSVPALLPLGVGFFHKTYTVLPMEYTRQSLR